ncbi:hypothetical protein KM043_002362 [Ampulex compressa]|nr:hypothetical protein KM043_002362 [Ampulex compressa]
MHNAWGACRSIAWETAPIHPSGKRPIGFRPRPSFSTAPFAFAPPAAEEEGEAHGNRGKIEQEWRVQERARDVPKWEADGWPGQGVYIQGSTLARANTVGQALPWISSSRHKWVCPDEIAKLQEAKAEIYLLIGLSAGAIRRLKAWREAGEGGGSKRDITGDF